MTSLHLDTGELKNKSIILEDNIPLTDADKENLKNFNVIYIGRDFNQSLYGLPNCIKAIRFNIHDEFDHMWHNTAIIDRVLMTYKNFAFNQPLQNLHYGLEYLELYGITTQELNNLPTSLKFLVIYIPKCVNLEYLPESLEVLYLHFTTLTYESQINLPKGIKELYLNGGCEGTINSLPSGLKVLYINGIYTKLNKSIELPTELQTFIFNDTEWNKDNKNIIKWLFKNKKMPQNLKKCIFPLHYVDIYTELKAYAREYINNEIDWKFIDIIPDNLVNHIKQIYN